MSKHLISPEMGVLLMNLPKNAIAAAKELKDGEDDDVIRQTIQLIQVRLFIVCCMFNCLCRKNINKIILRS